MGSTKPFWPKKTNICELQLRNYNKRRSNLSVRLPIQKAFLFKKLATLFNVRMRLRKLKVSSNLLPKALQINNLNGHHLTAVIAIF
jgi:hypothetical protein